jgi:(p)ppGpp synthase/HD superfamily hydrolase
MKLSKKLYKALSISSVAHKNQERRGSHTPYIIHPFGVMYIASGYTDNEDVLIACLLHDIIEDVPNEYSKEQMIDDFGQNVYNIVRGVTKNKSNTNWKQGCDEYLDYLEHKAPEESSIVAAADKIHNIMSILNDYDVLGEKVWDLFATDKQSQKWWFNATYAVVEKKIPNNEIVKELAEKVESINALIDSKA